MSSEFDADADADAVADAGEVPSFRGPGLGPRRDSNWSTTPTTTNHLYGTRDTLKTSSSISQTSPENDITSNFQQAASGAKLETDIKSLLTSIVALGTGQLVKDELFTLFEAVGALEVHQPKLLT